MNHPSSRSTRHTRSPRSPHSKRKRSKTPKGSRNSSIMMLDSAKKTPPSNPPARWSTGLVNESTTLESTKKTSPSPSGKRRTIPGKTLSPRKSPRTPRRSTRKMIVTPMDDDKSENVYSRRDEDDDLLIIPENKSERWQIPYKKDKERAHLPIPVKDVSVTGSFFHEVNSRNESSYSEEGCSSLDSAKRRVDENFIHYTRLENAALRIQRNFRSRIKSGSRSELVGDIPRKDESDADDLNFKEDEEAAQESVEESNLFTLIFLGLFCICQLVLSIINKCSGVSGGDVDGVLADAALVETAVKATPPGGIGGGGAGCVGGGATAQPPGLQSMAGQAAGAAGGAAAAGAAAGAAAAAAAGSAAAGATAATAATAQLVAAVAVTSAVATAAAGTSTFLTPPTSPEVIFTKCGLVNPNSRIGKFAMVFEGFPRSLDERESNIMEGLVLDAYNEITVGQNFTGIESCLDPLKREMEEVNIVEQTFTPVVGGIDGSSYLEISFQTKIVCDKCLASRPLFKNEQDQGLSEQEEAAGSRASPARFLRGKERGLEGPDGPKTQDGFQDEFQATLQDERALFDPSGAAFFQRLIQKIILNTQELSLTGELPAGFVSVTQAYVTPTPKENGVEVDDAEDSSGGVSGGSNITSGEPSNDSKLFTQVKFQNQGGKGVFQFIYVDEETQETVQETMVIDPTDPAGSIFVPTTSLPTFAPTKEPTVSPSTTPTAASSGQPTTEPTVSTSIGPTVTFSSQPSIEPTLSPSTLPTVTLSNRPSIEPTLSPSTVPTITFSGQPTKEPSKNPSSAPSRAPSTMPSSAPSTLPSAAPSAIPSTSPSESPSAIPSESPSESPSDIPSSFPSLNPSMVPSFIPSTIPSFVPSYQPSQNPTSQPSSQPSTQPSSPSSQPSPTPSASPTGVTFTYIGQGNCSPGHSFCFFNGVASPYACQQMCEQNPNGLRGFDIWVTAPYLGQCICRYDDGYLPSPAGATCNGNNAVVGPITGVTPRPEGTVYCYANP